MYLNFMMFIDLDLQVIHQKYRISYDEITNDLCPVSQFFLFVTVCILGLFLLRFSS